jgi:hypothetical protein
VDFPPRPIDTSGLAYMRSIGFKTDSLTLKSDAGLPHIFYIKDNKLYSSYQGNGKIVKRARKYNKTKKYLLFGSHYYKKKLYLKQVDSLLPITKSPSVDGWMITKDAGAR